MRKIALIPQDIEPIDALSESREVLRNYLRETCLNIMTKLQDDEDFRVTFTVGDRTTVYKIDFPRSQAGRILGTGGKTINSIRTIMAAAAAVRGFRCIVEIPYYSKQK